MTRRVVAALAAGCALAGPALACSCPPSPGSAALDRAAPVIFTGRVLSVVRDGRMASARIAVIRSVKGDARGVVGVHTPGSGPACGLVLEPGQVRRIRAAGSGGRYAARLCQNL